MSQHQSLGKTSDYVGCIEKADHEKLAKLVKLVGMLLQTKSCLFSTEQTCPAADWHSRCLERTRLENCRKSANAQEKGIQMSNPNRIIFSVKDLAEEYAIASRMLCPLMRTSSLEGETGFA